MQMATRAPTRHVSRIFPALDKPQMRALGVRQTLHQRAVHLKSRSATRLPRRRVHISHLTYAIMPRTSTNPALRHANFRDAERAGKFNTREGVMSLEGTVDKTAILLALTATSATFSWMNIYSGAVAGATVMACTQAAGVVGMILALATCFKPHWAPRTTPLYAICKGLALGGTSAFLEMMYPGLVIQTLCLTFGTLLTLLLGYRSGVMTVNEGFRSTVYTATGGFFLGMMGMMLMRMCGVAVPFMYSGPIGIVVSLVSVALAASNLLLDFDRIQMSSYRQMPKW
eukprot:CAMPEP_0114230670 /NCGR_PEP_ID=MMETSP0058-20121206/3600_1 /TAXON_ID=36894 /ORGANISM="Pyramimonas parkeae, CCMP726" /LENGTH=284 /DNA_ID=CAMNT_0001341899 /DNA_START=32 /DNA_END=883 /DNA_ORIENTATION=+